MEYLDKSEGHSAESEDKRATRKKEIHEFAAAMELGDEAMFTVLTEMEKARATLAAEELPGMVDFRILPRGGRKHAELTGKGVHATQAVSKSDIGRDWARRRGLQITFKATHGPGVTPEDAGVLCRAWAHRMQFFFDMHLTNPTPKELFSDAHVAEYAEPTEFRDLAARVASAKLHERIALIRKIPFR